jgi:CRP/FNR family cyclic AMP-dependent transcriptional regulator
MAVGADLVESLSRLSLFADLSRPQLQAIAHEYGDEMFADGQRVLRRGLSGSALYVVLEGEAVVTRGESELNRVGPGEVIGEISALLGEPPTADVVATRPLRCIVLGGPDVETFLVDHPRVMFRMLQAQARRLRNANRRMTANQ